MIVFTNICFALWSMVAWNRLDGIKARKRKQWDRERSAAQAAHFCLNPTESERVVTKPSSYPTDVLVFLC